MDQKTYFVKVDRSTQTPSTILGPPWRQFWILQAVRRGGAGGERVPPALLGWYLFQRKVEIDLLLMTTYFETLLDAVWKSLSCLHGTLGDSLIPKDSPL